MVDFDPDGIAIFSTYKHGSASLSHETSQICLPQIQWLGLRSEQVLSRQAPHADQGLLTLTIRDRKKARNMLGWQVLERENSLRRDLQVMLMLGFKAELQLLDTVRDGMSILLESGLPV
jgi:meiotic recombination protein SPO11